MTKRASIPIDDLYLEWLYRIVGSVRNKNPQRSYWKLFRKLYSTEFIWLIPNDDNRAEDGKELRYEFISSWNVKDVDSYWLNLGCSVLEMLIALARRASFDSDEDTIEWFWRFLVNLDLYRFNDAVIDDADLEYIEDVVNRFLFRNYTRKGVGGLFPLMHPPKDQRKVELWYQLSSYLLEA